MRRSSSTAPYIVPAPAATIDDRRYPGELTDGGPNNIGANTNHATTAAAHFHGMRRTYCVWRYRSALKKKNRAVMIRRSCEMPAARLFRIGGEYGCARTSVMGASVSQPAAHTRMKGLRRCANCRTSSAQMTAAPNAAALYGLIAIVSGS